MSHRRFFVLDETCPASEIEAMMGRVVANKLLPLQKFAPVEPLNPQGIVSDILPAPSISSNRKELLSAARDNGVQASLGSLFGITYVRSYTEKMELESKEIKKYSLNNPEDVFDKLMENDAYAQDVQTLLSSIKKTHAYFVTGFLTTSGAIWTRSKSHSHSSGISISVPLSDSAKIVTPAAGPNRTILTQSQMEMHVVEEEIFAVAYNIVKVSYGFDKTASKLIKAIPVFGLPKRANAKHLALGKDDEEDTEVTGMEGIDLDGDLFLVGIEDDIEGDTGISVSF